MLGFLLVIFEAWQRLRWKAAFPIATFLFLCNTFGSFAGRFFTFAIFLIVVATLFRRDDAPRDYVS